MKVMFFYKIDGSPSSYYFSVIADEASGGELHDVSLELPVRDGSGKTLNDKPYAQLSEAEKSLLEKMIPACIEAAQSEYETPMLAEFSWQAGIPIKEAVHLHDDVYQCTDHAGNTHLVYSLKYARQSGNGNAIQIETIDPAANPGNKH